MRKADLAVALVLNALGIVIIADAARLGFGWGPSGPESGFFPFYLGLGLFVCSVLVFVKAFRATRKGKPDKRLMPEGAWKPIAWVLLPAAAMCGLTELIGLHLSAAAYLAFYMLAVGKIGWKTTVLVSLITPTLLYVMFDKVFMVPLPQGLWGAKLIPF
jgi:hypothetical protein